MPKYRQHVQQEQGDVEEIQWEVGRTKREQHGKVRTGGEEGSRTKKEQHDKVPTGCVVGQGGFRGRPASISSLNVSGIGGFAEGTRHYQNTFEVEEKHERLTNGGVRFSVETVPAAEDKHIHKLTIGRDAFLARIKASENVRLEAVSKCPENLVFAGGIGFFAACLSAFAQHLPLALSPDHIWACILYAFAKHVDKHAEELRKNFVKHKGKKRLEVVADDTVMSGGIDPDSGSSAKAWEQTIFPSFSKQIRQHIGEKVHSAVVCDFSTTTATSRAAHEITLMSTMKHYFSYGMGSMCGIPKITLLGSEEDWVSVRTRAEALGELMTSTFRKLWMPFLLPVLDEFVESYRGQVNHGFWQSMVKLRYEGGSGASSVVSGWMQILFPYLKSGELNMGLRLWQEMYFHGPDPDNIPAVISSAPVDWDYYGTTYNLHFQAGFTGCTQDPVDGTLTPVMGWHVTHDPPQDPEKRLETIKDEIMALLKGHAKEAQADVLDKTEPWYARVSVLHFEQKSVEGVLVQKIESEKAELSCCCSSESRKKKKKIMLLERKLNELGSIPCTCSTEEMVRSYFTRRTGE